MLSTQRMDQQSKQSYRKYQIDYEGEGDRDHKPAFPQQIGSCYNDSDLIAEPSLIGNSKGAYDEANCDQKLNGRANSPEQYVKSNADIEQIGCDQQHLRQCAVDELKACHYK